MIFSLHFPQITDVIKSISQDFQDPKKASISIMTYFSQHTPYHMRNCMLFGHLSNHFVRLFSPTSTIIYFRTVEGETSLPQHNFGHNIFLTVHTPFHLHKDKCKPIPLPANCNFALMHKYSEVTHLLFRFLMFPITLVVLTYRNHSYL